MENDNKSNHSASVEARKPRNSLKLHRKRRLEDEEPYSNHPAEDCTKGSTSELKRTSKSSKVNRKRLRTENSREKTSRGNDELEGVDNDNEIMGSFHEGSSESGATPFENLLQISRDDKSCFNEPCQSKLRGTNPCSYSKKYRRINIPSETPSAEESCRALSGVNPRTLAVFHQKVGKVLFPVQAAVIPFLVKQTRVLGHSFLAADISVCAPTGEGKTLCYVLPIVNALLTTVVPRLRCVTLTPTRELALQVAGVFERYSRSSFDGTGIKSGNAADNSAIPARRLNIICLAGIETKQSGSNANFTGNYPKYSRRIHESSVNTPDVAVCTPGRFADFAGEFVQCVREGRFSMARLNFTSLQWLVLDEADRMLRQSYNNWLAICQELSDILSEYPRRHGLMCSVRVPPFRKLLFSATMTSNPRILHSLGLYAPVFFSSSPAGSSRMPHRLHQFYTLCSADQKAIVTMVILYKLAGAVAKRRAESLSLGLGIDNRIKSAAKCNDAPKNDAMKCVIFCGSKQLACRLTRILQLHFEDRDKSWSLIRQIPAFNPENEQQQENKDLKSGSRAGDSNADLCAKPPTRIFHFSAALLQAERTRIYQRFRDGGVDVLVCSDVATRGLDISSVFAVIHYTPPQRAQSYVHRAGRSGRARQEGYSFSLLSREELPRFKAIMAKKNIILGSDIKRYNVPSKQLGMITDEYPVLLERLREEVHENGNT